jgi:uncharacterized membrane protein
MMNNSELIRRALLLLGAGACIRGVMYAVGVVYAACPMAALLLLLGCVCVLMMAVANWRDTDEAERYYAAREVRRRAARNRRRAR